jgi:hypothetical protein
VYSGQAKETFMLSLLAILPGCRHPEDHTYQDKYGLLQGLRNMQSGVPGTGYNHGVAHTNIQSGWFFGKKRKQGKY